ncbi:MAG: Tab2/Atab2 family RNA-binding protein [Cyanobacteria bacterium P01_A01_bin.17]
MTKVWEIDFYSRPILDEQQKKIWELLVCDTQRSFEYTQQCSGAEANARWLQNALTEAMEQWRQSQGLAVSEQPEKIRFFRRQMSSIITRACKGIGIPAQASRRTFAIYQWLQERSLTVYPQHPGYQPLMAPPAQFEPVPPQSLPDALVGRSWSIATLPLSAFAEMQDWEIAFNDPFPLELVKLPADTNIPGLIIFSERAVPLAGWMSGLELAFLKFSPKPKPQLLLETGLVERWVLSNLQDPTLVNEVEAFERTKQEAQQLHFLAIQSSPEAQDFAGFWLLQELLPD